MYKGYQNDDARFIDYQLYQLPGVHGTFRGPPIASSEYIACVGAAQTFGRFAHQPYPALLSRSLGIDALNLGRGGVGPTFPLSSPALIEYINRARLVVLQVFSGRSQSNSLFQTSNHGPNGTNLANGKTSSADEFYTWLLSQDAELTAKIVAETRENYLAAMKNLMLAIEPPKILLWFSVRPPEYQESIRLPLHHLWAQFPHFVNRPMVDQLQGHLQLPRDLYIECVSQRGLPQQLTSPAPMNLSGDAVSPLPKENGLTVNRYYPSPEMHEDAANLLLPACLQLLGRGQDKPATLQPALV